MLKKGPDEHPWENVQWCRAQDGGDEQRPELNDAPRGKSADAENKSGTGTTVPTIGIASDKARRKTAA